MLNFKLLTTPEEETLWARIKEIAYKLLYGGSAEDYENFSFGNTVVTYRMIILALALGLIIASAVMIYKRNVLGRLVRALSRADAFDKDSAKSLSELSLQGSFAIVSSLKRGSLLRLVSSVKKEEHEEKMREIFSEDEGDKKGERAEKKRIGEFKPSPLTDRYFLPGDESKREALMKLFSEKGSGALSFILTLVLCIGASAVLFYAVPFFLSLFDSAL